jgi:hypothetical protein
MVLRTGFTESSHYNHSVFLKVPKNLNEENLEKAFIELTKHHDALRLKFEKSNKELIQFNNGLTDDAIFTVEDSSSFSPERLHKDIERQQTVLIFQKVR